MNVYDFDKTIYDGDSTIDFYFYCLRKDFNIIRSIPVQIKGLFLYKIGKISKTACKEMFFDFLRNTYNLENKVKCFWDENEHKIKKWYKNKQKSDDVIISASPYFLLYEICNRLKIAYLIASDVEMNTGKFKSKNCYGDEKLRKFRERFPNAELDEFYSDSHSDMPMALIAKDAYIVKKEDIYSW